MNKRGIELVKTMSRSLCQLHGLRKGERLGKQKGGEKSKKKGTIEIYCWGEFVRPIFEIKGRKKRFCAVEAVTSRLCIKTEGDSRRSDLHWGFHVKT